MLTTEAMRHPLASISPVATLQEAATAMSTLGVGALVVIEDGLISGIVTDRDLVTRALAKGLPADARIDSVMTTEVVTIDASSDLRAAYALFRRHAVRRLPIVEDGKAIGLVSADDLVIDLSADLSDLVRPIIGEVIFGHHESDFPVPAPAGAS